MEIPEEGRVEPKQNFLHGSFLTLLTDGFLEILADRGNWAGFKAMEIPEEGRVEPKKKTFFMGHFLKPLDL